MSYKDSISSLERNADKTCTKCSNPRHRSKSGIPYTRLCTYHHREYQREFRKKYRQLNEYKVEYGFRDRKFLRSIEEANKFIKECIDSGYLIRSLIKIE